jgi:hypothetical protein
MSTIFLDDLRVASPCAVPWSEMKGNEVVRHCDDCKKNVYNISNLTREEAASLIREKEGKLCVTFYRRSDGTLLTADCPVGLAAVRKQYIRTKARVAAMAVAIWGAVLGFFSSCTQSTQFNNPPPDPAKVCGDTTLRVISSTGILIPPGDMWDDSLINKQLIKDTLQ